MVDAPEVTKTYREGLNRTLWASRSRVPVLESFSMTRSTHVFSIDVCIPENLDAAQRYFSKRIVFERASTYSFFLLRYSREGESRVPSTPRMSCKLVHMILHTRGAVRSSCNNVVRAYLTVVERKGHLARLWIRVIDDSKRNLIELFPPCLSPPRWSVPYDMRRSFLEKSIFVSDVRAHTHATCLLVRVLFFVVFWSPSVLPLHFPGQQQSTQ